MKAAATALTFKTLCLTCIDPTVSRCEIGSDAKSPVYNSVRDIRFKLYSVLSPVYRWIQAVAGAGVHPSHDNDCSVCGAAAARNREMVPTPPLLRQPGIWIQARAMNRAGNEPL